MDNYGNKFANIGLLFTLTPRYLEFFEIFIVHKTHEQL